MKITKSRKTREKIPERIRTILWAAAAGRCEYKNCNAPLLGDLISGKAQLNKACSFHFRSVVPNWVSVATICMQSSANRGNGVVGRTTTAPSIYSRGSIAR